MQVDVVKVSVPARGERAWDVGWHVLIETKLHVFRAKAEDRVTTDHLDSGAPCDDAELIRVDPLRLENGSEAVFDGGGRHGDGEEEDKRRGDRYPTLPEPRQVQATGGRSNPDATGLAKKDRNGDQN